MQYLTTYNPISQHYGEWLRGFDWAIYGCGTFRDHLRRNEAIARSKRFFDTLSRRHNIPVAYFGVVEGRDSGLGMPAIRDHLHFLAASSCDPEALRRIAEDLWSHHYGDAMIHPHEPSLSGAYYVAKLAPHENGGIISGNLDRLPYHGPADLIQAAELNPYVPDRLKKEVFGTFLVMRNSMEAAGVPST